MELFVARPPWPAAPMSDLNKTSTAVSTPEEQRIKSCVLRGPAAILFISRDTCSDSIAKLFRACFYGVSHNYRAICCKTGYRTDVPVQNKVLRGGGVSHLFGGTLTSPKKYRAIWGIAAIVSQYRAIWGH